MGVSELLLSFVAAYEHIPTQRRLDLFISLVDKVGPGDHLFALIAILLDKYPSNSSVLQFATGLSSRYSVMTRLQVRILTNPQMDGSDDLQMVKQFMGLILDARKPKPSFSKSLLHFEDVDEAISNLLPLGPATLADPNLISRVARNLSEGGKDAANICALFTDIFEDTLILSEHYRDTEACRCPWKLYSKTIKADEAIVNVPCMQLLDASLRLMPMSQLLESLQILLARTEDNVSEYCTPDTREFKAYPLQVREHALRSYGHRLNDKKLDLKASQDGCLRFLPQLAQIVKENSNVSLKKTAVACIDRTAELFGKKDVAAIVAIAKHVAGDECLGSSEKHLRIISMFCLATMVEVSGHSFISILTLALPKAMDSLATSIGEDTEDSALHNAVYSFLGALILHVPWMVTGADLAILLKLSFRSANAKMGEDCDRGRVEALRLLPRKVDVKECFGTLIRTWADATTEGPLVSINWVLNFGSVILNLGQAVREHLEILRLTIDRQPKSIISQYSETLGDLFVEMLDFRRIQLSPVAGQHFDIAGIGLVEDIVNETAISMIYKFNDATFRPIFSRMLEWTAIPKSKDLKAWIHRQTTWYTFLLKFFSTLKVCSQIRLESAGANHVTTSPSSPTMLPS